MISVMSQEMVRCLFNLIEGELESMYDISLYYEDSIKLKMYIYEPDVLRNILKEFNYKDAGSMMDYESYFPQEDTYDDSDIPADFNMFKRIAVSEKINSVVMYSSTSYRSVACMFIIDKDNFEKFIKKAKPYIQFEDSVNMLSQFDFKPKAKNEYFDIMPTKRRVEGRVVDVVKRKLEKENLVFDKTSQIYSVMTDIETFFTKETKKMYKSIDIPYKRGIIIYGDPGNGKSAMIREIIRTLNKRIVKIIINPSTRNITEVLSSLVEKMAGKECIIVIEDIDSLITDYNRSEFLNILDGINSKSGIYFIGTTNYPDKIDPAFMNRSGRFDRTYEIGNPNEIVRRAYFESHKIGNILKEFTLSKNPDNTLSILDMFTTASEGMSMANLKELIILTKTELVKEMNTATSIEEAVDSAAKILKDSREAHKKSHQKYKFNQSRRFDEYNEDDMYDDED